MYSIPLLLSERIRIKTNPITSEKKVYDKIINALYLDVTLKDDADDSIQLAGYTLQEETEYGLVQAKSL